MTPQLLLRNKPVLASGSLIIHSTDRSATILLDDASFTIHVFDPSEGEAAPDFQVDEKSFACAAMPNYFANLQFGPGGKYWIRISVNYAHVTKNGFYIVHYSLFSGH